MTDSLRINSGVQAAEKTISEKKSKIRVTHTAGTSEPADWLEERYYQGLQNDRLYDRKNQPYF